MQQSRRVHAAIIMDGNGRWAQARGWDRLRGHQAGGGVAERIIEAAPGLGIGVLTLYAFSSDNWSRPMPEVAGLMRLLRLHLRRERSRARANGVAVEVVGRRDRLATALVREIARTEEATRGGTSLRLRLAVDYSSRDAILAAAQRCSTEPVAPDRARFATLLEPPGYRPAPAVDLLIRTGGECRLSDFLLWECAYAELFFRATMWPEFTVTELRDIISEFHRRQRRFGGVVSTPTDEMSERRIG